LGVFDSNREKGEIRDGKGRGGTQYRQKTWLLGRQKSSSKREKRINKCQSEAGGTCCAQEKMMGYFWRKHRGPTMH